MVKNILKRLLQIKVVFCLILLLNLSVVVHILQTKQAFHSDEQWSYAHANSSKGAYLDVEIDSFYQINDSIRQRLFNHWIDGEVFKDYLTVQPEERFSYRHIYENLKIVEHPPLYFTLLHTISSFFPNTFDKWYAGLINILLFILIYIALFKLAELMVNDNRLALCSVALWGFSEIGLDTVVFLRMYILQTLLSVCLMYETIKIIKANTASGKQLVLVFLYSFLGILTQYNSIFFSFFVALVACLILLKRKNYKLMFSVGGVMALSVIMLFIVFPPAYDVLLGSMRGKQVLSALNKAPQIEDNIFTFLWQMDLRVSKLIDMFALHFLTFNRVNYQMLGFFFIIGGVYKYLLKEKSDISVILLLSVTVLYSLYLFAMPNMGIFHNRYFMNIAPFWALLAVMFVNWLLKQMKLKPDCIALIIAILVVANSMRLDFAKQSPYAFKWGVSEGKTAQKIKESDVFINAGNDVIALHSMVYYLRNAKRIYITEDICNSATVSSIEGAKNPVVLTYSSYMLSTIDKGKITCLEQIGLRKMATICPSQRCYNVWEKS